MMAHLTRAERTIAMLMTGTGVLIGLLMAMAGRGDGFGAHGWVVLAFCAVLFFCVASALEEPQPTEDRTASYYDDPTRVGIILSLSWAVIAMGMGVWVALQLAWPDLRFDAAWSSFGRLRPVHTSGGSVAQTS